MKKLLLLTALLPLAGCAFLNSTTIKTTTDPKTGLVTTEKTHAMGYTVLDAKSSLAKFRNQSSPSENGTNTYAPGTYVSGLEQQSSGSNLVLIISGVSGAVVQGAVSGLK